MELYPKIWEERNYNVKDISGNQVEVDEGRGDSVQLELYQNDGRDIIGSKF